MMNTLLKQTISKLGKLGLGKTGQCTLTVNYSTKEKFDYTFKPNFHVVTDFKNVFPIADLEREIGVYSATPEFIRSKCGDITNLILAQVPDWYYEESDRLGLYPNCDVRIHRLYPSDFPAYPGWHCDGEFRETYFSQPDLNRIQVHKHLIATVSSHDEGVSNTEFLDQDFQFASDRINPDHGLWQQVNEILEATPNKKVVESKDGQLMCFDSWTLHRACPTKNRGWRLFFRMAMWHKKNIGDGGMITKQEQIYKYVGHYGW
jgi:hypothetical protein